MAGTIGENRVHYSEGGIESQTAINVITIGGIAGISLPGEVHKLAGCPWGGRKNLEIGYDLRHDDGGVGIGVQRVVSL